MKFELVSLNIYWLIIYNPSCFFFAAFHVFVFTNLHSLYLFTYNTSCPCLRYSFFAVFHFFKVLPVFMNVQYFLYLYTVQYYIVPFMQYTIDLSAVHYWFVCSTSLICLQYTIDLSAVLPLFVYSTSFICLQY